MTGTTALLTVDDLHHMYAPGRKTLRGVSFSLNRGETMCVVGPSGSGKSTLIRCLNALESMSQGRIVFDSFSLPVSERRATELRRRIGMVFQSFNLFTHLTAVENVALAPIHVRGIERDRALRLAMALLDQVHLADRFDHFPDELSGGQQQRVAIARALALEPTLMLYDEPTSALDPEMVREVLDVIAELKRGGMTSIIVTHEMEFALNVGDRLLFLDAGEVVEDTVPSAFFAGPDSERGRRFLRAV